MTFVSLQTIVPMILMRLHVMGLESWGLVTVIVPRSHVIPLTRWRIIILLGWAIWEPLLIWWC